MSDVIMPGPIRATVRLLWSNCDRLSKVYLSIAIAIAIAIATFQALSPIALKLVIERLTVPIQGQLILPMAWLAIYFLSQYMSHSLEALQSITYGRGERRVNRRISLNSFAHIIHLPLKFHLQRRTGALSETVVLGLRGYELILENLIYTIVPITVSLGMTCAVLVSFNHGKYVAIIGIGAAAYLFAFIYAARKISKGIAGIADAQKQTQAQLTDSLLNYEMIKCFVAEEALTDRYDIALQAKEKGWNKYYRSVTVSGLLLTIIFIAVLSLSLIGAARDVIIGTLTVGDFVLINAYCLQAIMPLERVGHGIIEVTRGLGIAQGLIRLLDEKAEANHVGAPLSSEVHGSLSFEDVCFSYGSGSPALKSVSFGVDAGSTIGLVGGSGSGKTTIVRLILGLLDTNSGSIRIDDIEIGEWPRQVLRQSIAVVPQDLMLFDDTLKYNICFGKMDCSMSDVQNAAKLAHLELFVASLPDGYETRVGERGVKLSGGERQRVAIARALIKRPKIFVFDEATSSLDSATERDIMKSVSELSSECTSIVIAHRLSTIMHADQILVMDDGAIVESGSHRELLEIGGYYSRLWHAQRLGRPYQ